MDSPNFATIVESVQECIVVLKEKVCGLPNCNESSIFFNAMFQLIAWLVLLSSMESLLDVLVADITTAKYHCSVHTTISAPSINTSAINAQLLDA
jgi:hypothetical protein